MNENKSEKELADLHAFFEEYTVPHSKRSAGFLEIIGKQYHENINSALYAHFINSGNEEVKRLFLNTLLEIVKRKSRKTFNFVNANAQTEVNTGKGRIDILISNSHGNERILIENKIRHWLNNDLIDYWQSVETTESKKVGLLLTLHPHKIPDYVLGKYFNITHLEWLTLVKNQMIPNKLPENYRVYISDFISTIEQLSTSYTMNEAARFYFQHTKQVLKAQATIEQAHTFINNQVQLIADTIGWQVSGGSIDWRNIRDGHNNLDTFLTIITHDLIKGEKTFTLILELSGKDMERAEELKNHLAGHPQFMDKKLGPSGEAFVHLCSKYYTITDEELEDFAGLVIRKIRKDFADMTVKAIRYMYPTIDISEWERKLLGLDSDEG